MRIEGPEGMKHGVELLLSAWPDVQFFILWHVLFLQLQIQPLNSTAPNAHPDPQHLLHLP